MGNQPKWLEDRLQGRGDPVLMDGGMGTEAKRIFTDLAAAIFPGSVLRPELKVLDSRRRLDVG